MGTRRRRDREEQDREERARNTHSSTPRCRKRVLESAR
jgi:hypothetical protein